MAPSHMNAWLILWHQLLDDAEIPPFSDPDEMAGVLADFRRDPGKLIKAFKPLPRGDEVLARVNQCIAADRQTDAVYLAPNPMESTDDKLRSLVVDALERARQCCEIEVPDYPISVVRREMTVAESSQCASLTGELGNTYIDHAYSSRGLESEAMQFLWETLYTLAASTVVRGYCLTPLCPEDVRKIDPYAPQFELWLRGAQPVIRWKDGSDDYWVEVFVSP